MKPLFYALLVLAFSTNARVSLAQYGSENNLKYYQTIPTEIALEEDRSDLFLALKVADLRLEPGQSEEAKARCMALLEFCQKSIYNPSVYTDNKEIIASLISAVFRLQPPLFQESFRSKVEADYNSARREKYLKTLFELKSVNSSDSTAALLNHIENELAVSKYKGSSEFITVMVDEHLNSLIEGLGARLTKATTPNEVDRIFELSNFLINRTYNVESEKDIAIKISEALKPGFTDTKNFLGDLLLEGYKNFLIKRGKIPGNPTHDDVTAVYEFVIASSNQLSLNRNILLAQTNLLERGILTCFTPTVAKIQRGWNWTANDDRLNIIPFIMLDKTKDEIIQHSKFGRNSLESTHSYFTDRAKVISLFNYRYDKFSRLTRISRGIRPLIFDDPLLKLDEDLRYEGCQLIHYITREGFFRFPNQ